MHSFRSKTHILGIFTPFRCSTMSVWFRTTYFMSKTRVLGGSRHFVAAPDPLWKSVSGAFNAWVYASETISCFLQRTCAIHYFMSKTHVLGGSKPFRSSTWYVAKTGIEEHLMHGFVPLEPILFFCSKNAQSTTLGPKLMFLKVSCHFVDAPDPLWKLVSACIWLNVSEQ